jgi:hypothetical protein
MPRTQILPRDGFVDQIILICIESSGRIIQTLQETQFWP